MARIWVASCAIAMALHLAIAAWLFALPEPPDPAESFDGASIPIDLTAVAIASSDISAPRIGPPAPDVAAQEASRFNRTSELPPAAEKSDILIEQQSISDQDVVLQKPAPDEIKEEAPPKDEQKPEPPSPERQAAAAQEAAAPPRADAVPAPTPKSASEGISPSAQRSRSTWERALVVHLDRHKRYPDAARRDQVVGEAVVEFLMRRNGTVVSRRILKGSGSPLLDQEALALFDRAAPLPIPPLEVSGESFLLNVPIRFRIR
jgi:protein TonB